MSGIFNVGTGNSNTFNKVAKSIIDYYGTGHIEYTLVRKSYQSYTKADNKKLINSGYNLPLLILKRFNRLYELLRYFVF